MSRACRPCLWVIPQKYLEVPASGWDLFILANSLPCSISYSMVCLRRQEGLQKCLILQDKVRIIVSVCPTFAQHARCLLKVTQWPTFLLTGEVPARGNANTETSHIAALITISRAILRAWKAHLKPSSLVLNYSNFTTKHSCPWS